MIKEITLSVQSDEDYFTRYHLLLCAVYNLKYKDDIRLMLEMSGMASSDGHLLLPSSSRAKLCSKLNLHTTNFSKSISRLKQLGVISGDRGDYTLLPIFLAPSSTTEGITIKLNYVSTN